MRWIWPLGSKMVGSGASYIKKKWRSDLIGVVAASLLKRHIKTMYRLAG
jgi:hypothetical protein